jgi:transposase-like protein
MPLPENLGLSYLWVMDPLEAARAVLEALESAPNVKGAAAKLGVSWRTLYRWCQERPELSSWAEGNVRSCKRSKRSA